MTYVMPLLPPIEGTLTGLSEDFSPAICYPTPLAPLVDMGMAFFYIAFRVMRTKFGRYGIRTLGKRFFIVWTIRSFVLET